VVIRGGAGLMGWSSAEADRHEVKVIAAASVNTKLKTTREEKRAMRDRNNSEKSGFTSIIQ
jgi:hypothetical protein